MKGIRELEGIRRGIGGKEEFPFKDGEMKNVCMLMLEIDDQEKEGE